jgi:hypothetical protein
MAYHLREFVLVVVAILHQPFSVMVTRVFEILFLRAVYPNDWLNAPELAFETAMTVQTKSMARLNEIEKRVVLAHPVFALFLFEINLPAFQLQVVPIPVQLTPIRIVLLLLLLSFQSSLLVPQKKFS